MVLDHASALVIRRRRSLPPKVSHKHPTEPSGAVKFPLRVAGGCDDQSVCAAVKTSETRTVFGSCREPLAGHTRRSGAGSWRAEGRVALHRRRRVRTRAICQSTRSTPATSRSSRLRGCGGATTSGRPWTTSSDRPASTWTACSTPSPGSAGRSPPSTRQRARRCGPIASRNTTRFERGMRNNYGKGVAYGEVNGRGRHLLHVSRFLPPRLRRQDRRAHRELGHRCADTRIPPKRRDRHASGSRAGLGAVDGVGPQVRPRKGNPAGARQPVDLVTAHRRERRRGGRQRARAGLLPDAHREHPRRHPRLRREKRESTCGSSTSSRGPASSVTRRGRTTRGRRQATSRPGRRCRPILSEGSSTFRPTRRPSTSLAASGRATTCSARASSPSTSRRASACGISRPSITTSGTSTIRPRRSCWT